MLLQRVLRDDAGDSGSNHRECQTVLDAAWQSVANVDQFHGIELGEFPDPHCGDGAVDSDDAIQIAKRFTTLLAMASS